MGIWVGLRSETENVQSHVKTCKTKVVHCNGQTMLEFKRAQSHGQTMWKES